MNVAQQRMHITFHSSKVPTSVELGEVLDIVEILDPRTNAGEQLLSKISASRWLHSVIMQC
jgi:hypothetical protein